MGGREKAILEVYYNVADLYYSTMHDLDISEKADINHTLFQQKQQKNSLNPGSE